MKTTVVTGMLGAGKTTFVGAFLRGRRERAVVLVNDFGALGIDGEVLSAGGVEAVELPSGCVCCTLKFDLITTVQRVVRQYAPEHLVIEPSGVASPSAVLEGLESAGVAGATVVGIVDATEFLELLRAESFGAFFTDQILNADAILVNKADLATGEAVRETVAAIESMNPAALVLPTVNADVGEPPAGGRRPRRAVRGGHPHFTFETLSFPLRAAAPLAALEVLLRELAAGRLGRVARAKALVDSDRGPWRLDLVFGRAGAAPFPQPVTRGRLVVIGESLDRAAIGEAVAAASRG